MGKIKNELPIKPQYVTYQTGQVQNSGNESGKTKKRHRGIKKLLFTAAIIGGVIYMPGLFMNGNSTEENVIVLDESVIGNATAYLKNSPDADFDSDGMNNSAEDAKNTSPWKIDTDGDHIADSCEVLDTKTDPVKANKDTIIQTQKKLDEEGENKVDDPLKNESASGVILWPEDYESRACGAAVSTPSGYSFCNFHGYCQFPEEDGNYPYIVENGKHTLLTWSKEKGAWKIDGDCNISIYDKPLSEIVCLKFLGFHATAGSNPVLSVVEKILPDHGFLTASRCTSADLSDNESGDKIIEIAKPVTGDDTDFRFGTDNRSLDDLVFVRDTIDSGACVAVSIYRDQSGEFRGIVYGYSSDGQYLYIADEEGKKCGRLTLTYKAYKCMTGTDTIENITSYDFVSNGFLLNDGTRLNSEEGDRINFYAASDASVDESPSNNNLLSSEESGQSEETSAKPQEDTEKQTDESKEG